jgi:hypothetical protein
MKWDRSFNISRRRLLYILGLGAVGLSAARAVVKADTLFAKQFARETTPVQLPDMVYDPDLQMMVDPVTRQPLYARVEMLAGEDNYKARLESTETPTPSPTATPPREPNPNAPAKALPTVTSGCSTCPKCDDNCG